VGMMSKLAALRRVHTTRTMRTKPSSPTLSQNMGMREPDEDIYPLVKRRIVIGLPSVSYRHRPLPPDIRQPVRVSYDTAQPAVLTDRFGYVNNELPSQKYR
jgi:hypothetical protein